MNVVLNNLDCSLDFLISNDGLTASTISEGGFGYMWSGGRATVGVGGGKFYFTMTVLKPLPVTVASTDQVDTTHVARVGVSYGDTDVGHLGETACSWGYGGTGKKCTKKIFEPYAEPFGPGDEIQVLVDMTNEPGTLSFVKNGIPKGAAYYIPRARDATMAVFPHVLLKNIQVRVDFQGHHNALWRPESQGFQPWQVGKLWTITNDDCHGLPT